jgi:hypothetical protein
MDGWIKFRKKLLIDGRVRELSRQCNATTVTVVGALVTLWAHADELADDNGVLVGYTAPDLDALVQLPGFAENMPPDWLAFVDGYAQVVNYQAHNGSTAKSRALGANRALASRSRNARSARKAHQEERREEKRRGGRKPIF